MIPSVPKTFVFNESNSLGTELNPVLNPFATERICLNDSYYIVAEVNPEVNPESCRYRTLLSDDDNRSTVCIVFTCEMILV